MGRQSCLRGQCVFYLKNISAHRKHTFSLLIFKKVNFQLNLPRLQFVICGDCFKVLKEKWLLPSLEFN